MALPNALALSPVPPPMQHAAASLLHVDRRPGLQLAPELAALIPEGCLRPGSTLEVGAGSGQTSLLLRLIAEPTARGAWAAVIGFDDLNPHAASGSGVALERLAMVANPGGTWLEVVAALLDTVELVVLNLQQECRPTDARRLLARARQRRSILILVQRDTHRGPPNRPPRRMWPEQPDIILTPSQCSWRGLEQGHGRLREAVITVNATGRRLNGPARSCRLRIGEHQTSHWSPGGDP
ncbi:MAG: hypothetical protein WC054_04460 [Candidatus Nanopelagicales bacterium]